VSSSGACSGAYRFAQEHRLSPMQTKLFELAIEERNNDEAAEAFGCARATISAYWSRILRKTGISRIFRTDG
jgi:DNA-binding CsgD family transcriptional regulator